MSAELASELSDRGAELLDSKAHSDINSNPLAEQAGASDFAMVMDIPVELTVELGRAKISIGKVMQLAHGSIIELNSLASSPMDVYANGLLIAQGEVVIVEGRFGLRLTDIVTAAERLRRIGKR